MLRRPEYRRLEAREPPRNRGRLVISAARLGRWAAHAARSRAAKAERARPARGAAAPERNSERRPRSAREEGEAAG